MDTEYPSCTENWRPARFCKSLISLSLRTRFDAGVTKTAPGAELDTHMGVTNTNKRLTDRKTVALPARLTWKDQRGATRFAAVIARNVSDFGVYVECHSPVSIPLYRLVQFQLERDVRQADSLPSSLLQGRVLSAVYRVTPPSPSKPQGLALRLMVDPRRMVTNVSANTAQVLAS